MGIKDVARLNSADIQWCTAKAYRKGMIGLYSESRIRRYNSIFEHFIDISLTRLFTDNW